MSEPRHVLANAKHIHIIGIGGVGMSGVAKLLLEKGHRISGSDLSPSPLTEALHQHGATIHSGHAASHVAEADLVLVSTAVPPDNPELVEARARSIPVLERRELLAELTAGAQVIAVAGTHGKTTTSALLALILERADRSPTVLVGGVIPERGTNAWAGRGEQWVVEADEYKQAFLGLTPRVAVVTNIELDHPDVFRDFEDVLAAFREFARRVPAEGTLVLCADDPGAMALRNELTNGRGILTYGFSQDADWRAFGLRPHPGGGTDFQVAFQQRARGRFSLRLPGEHNVQNSMAALAVAHELHIDLDLARQVLAEFGGVARRFQVLGEVAGIAIVDDYAHHPSEIRATLAAARQRYPGRRLWALFQPHTFTRTKALLREFAQALASAGS
ncbi:MAG: UDP-N-acetylmuramate--L-alanine ligase [Chloroflexi bacterium]|nr:UDP-N-acetylmuramate--L-alanine ligase [Chloroflexota bacterium]